MFRPVAVPAVSLLIVVTADLSFTVTLDGRKVFTGSLLQVERVCPVRHCGCQPETLSYQVYKQCSLFSCICIMLSIVCQTWSFGV
jgi:hypothetical protein